MGRIIRFLLVVLAIFAMLAAAGVALFMHYINPGQIERALAHYAETVLDARLELSAPVTVRHLPDLKISIPALKLRPRQGDAVIASIRSAEATVSLPALAIGAVSVKNLVVNELRTQKTLQELSIKGVFDGMLSTARFPKELKIGEVAVRNSAIALVLGNAGSADLKDFSFSLSHFSPESSSPLLFSTSFEAKESAPGKLLGITSGRLTGRAQLSVSSSGRYLALTKAHSNGEIIREGSAINALATCEHLRLDDNEIHALGVSTSASSVTDKSLDIHFKTPSLRIRGNDALSPQVHFAYSRDKLVTDFKGQFLLDGKKGLWQLAPGKVLLNIPAGPSVPADISASAQGKFGLSLADRRIDLDVTGKLGKHSGAFNGTFSISEKNALKGTLTLEQAQLTDEPLSSLMPWLSVLDVDLSVRTKKLHLGDTLLTNASANVRSQDKGLNVSDVAATLAGGKFSAQLNLKEDMTWSATANIEDAQAQELSKMLAWHPALSGRTRCTLSQITGKQASILTATGELSIAEGRILGLDLEAVRRHVITPKSTDVVENPTFATPFTELSAPFTFENGCLRAPDITIRALSLRVLADLTSDAKTGLQATHEVSFQPADNWPLFRIAGTISGPRKSAAIAFGWNEARKNVEQLTGRIVEVPVSKVASKPAPAPVVPPRQNSFDKFVGEVRNLKSVDEAVRFIRDKVGSLF